MKKLKLIIVLLYFGIFSFAKAQTPNWQLKCQYDNFGHANYHYDFDPGDEQKGVIINNADIMRTTTDGGQTWSNDISRPYNSCRLVKYIASNKMLTTGYKKMYISLDNGQTHTQINSNYPNYTIYSIDAKNNFILMGAEGHRVCYSTDGGVTITETPLTNNAQPFYDAYIVDSSFAYVIARAGVYYTLDKGQTWTKITNTLISGDFYEFCAKDRLNWLIGFQDANAEQRLFKTNDGGQNWQDITTLLPKENTLPSSPRVKLNNMFAAPDGQVFMAVSNKPALYSNDFCNTSLVYDSVDTSIDLSNSTIHQYKIINNKVYLLVTFSLSGTTTYRIYTTNFNNSNVSNDLTFEHVPFSLYPNPSNGMFSIQIEKPKATFDVLDIAGKLHETFTIENFGGHIQLNLPEGMYFIREQETGFTQKIIIQ